MCGGMLKGYLIFDIGTGNARVVTAGSDGTVHRVKREDIPYSRDPDCLESLFFDPQQLWAQLSRMAKEAIKETPEIEIAAITSTSQRQGIVLLDGNGDPFMGLPNIDFRGRKYEKLIPGLENIYDEVGRKPTTLFSALKLYAVCTEQPDQWRRVKAFTSISDWVLYMLSGQLFYEHSQATETLLYDVRKNVWSESLCGLFNIPSSILPRLRETGSIVGKVRSTYAADWNISEDALIIVGGADTQLAIKGTQPDVGEYVIVSGTTTPVTKLISTYQVDGQSRTWTNGHVKQGQWIMEANGAVTGLNYQRLKTIFYPNEDYRVMDREMAQIKDYSCLAVLGSVVSGDPRPLTRGGFIFSTPVSHELKRAHFTLAVLGDIACSILQNYHVLEQITGDEPGYVWGCGGGFQSLMLRQLVANLLKKEIRIRSTYRQSSVYGGVLICNDSLGVDSPIGEAYEVILPKEDERMVQWLDRWKRAREDFLWSQ